MSIKIALERDLEKSLCDYPELIEDTLFGIRQGMEVLGPHVPTLKRQDTMPNGGRADLVFVEESRVTVVEIKKGQIAVRERSDSAEDAIDQIADYLQQSRLKYPNRQQYRGFIVCTAIVDKSGMEAKIESLGEMITLLMVGREVPSVIRICTACSRAVGYFKAVCVCGALFP